MLFDEREKGWGRGMGLVTLGVDGLYGEGVSWEGGEGKGNEIRGFLRAFSVIERAR